MEYKGIAIVPLIIGLLEVFKKLGLKDKYVPIFSTVLGIGVGVSLVNDGDIIAGVVHGLYIGLSAVGLYSGTKNVIEQLS